MPIEGSGVKMKISYITTDLDFESHEDLSPIVEEIGERALPSHNAWVNKKYYVVLAHPADYEKPEQTVEGFCEILEGLSEASKKLWQRCSARVLDIGFDSGGTPTPYHCQLPAKLIDRVSALIATKMRYLDCDNPVGSRLSRL
jgi:hypothetical protein